MEEEENKDIIDRISELPEPIWQHILSFLVIKDACRTSILSKTWKNACATLLNFYDQSFFPITRPSFDDNQEMFYQNHQLLDLKPYIEKFLSLLFDANGKIKELVFRIGDCDNRNPLYTLPEAVYAAEWLNKLNLGGFKLEYSASSGGCMNNLKVLILHSLIINDNWVVDLFANLPFLEKFNFSLCWGFETVSISSNRIKELSLLSCRSLAKVEVNAPNLSSFRFSGNVSLSLSLEALAIENMYFVIDSKTSDSESEWHSKFVEFLDNFNLPRMNQSMLLDTPDSLLWIAPCLDTLILVYNRSMKTIQFTCGTSSTDEEKNPCCTSLHYKFWWQSLKKVKFENFQDVEDQWKLKTYFMENGKMLESIVGLNLIE
ncbi:hypothetical protein ACH5RR_037597 [Cinchona calisaya]|uniref:F-box domain-containing protein n=1 Tax=Cinchona calisaya TaxID=153742 RepID=A0ABD2YC49_9GENT